MKILGKQKALAGSERTHPPEHKREGPTDPTETITVTLILRRRPDGLPLRNLEEFNYPTTSGRDAISHVDFAAAHGAAQEDINLVGEFARIHNLEVVEAERDRRSVVVRGTVGQVNEAFGIRLFDYVSPLGRYHSYEGAVSLPALLIEIVEVVVGLDNRQLPARRLAADPPSTNPLVPQQVAQLYDFPAGSGAGQIIGIYEMVALDSNLNLVNPGYTAADLTLTMNAFGGGLNVPVPTDVAVDGQANAGVSDSETVLDITVASAIAQGAKIVVYFTGGTIQNVIHALQRMIHPGIAGPFPTVISISYGWSPDDDTSNITVAEYNQLDQLFQDAANLGITVLAASGDSGAQYLSGTTAQTAYPASDPWIIACGGTTIGNINGLNFDEYVWNDTFGGGIFGGGTPGATGGGVSARWLVPPYQNGFGIPRRNNTGTLGRGIPDVAGNASLNSGYPEYLAGNSIGPTGGTSAVAPLYAALIAIINANLGFSVGFINPFLYALSDRVFRDIVGAPGPTDNSFGSVAGYPAGVGWDACTGLGSIRGNALQSELMLWGVVPTLVMNTLYEPT